MELRWIRRPSLHSPSGIDVVLQYRARDLNEEYRFVWTEWTDVPVVAG